MFNKKAFQLSVTFLVMIIITIVIFSFSLYLIKQFFTATGEIEKQISGDIQKEIERRLRESGEKVAIPINQGEINIGDSKAFGLGIMNTLGGPPTTFHITMNLAENPLRDTFGHYTLDGDFVEDSLADPVFINENWLFENIPSVEIENNEQVVIPLTIRVDPKHSLITKSQEDTTYVFNVCVTTAPLSGVCQKGAPNLYTDTVYKIYVVVK